MAIERDPNIVFDPDGTLRATTSWISKHDEGLAELLKNVRYAYLPNRANVERRHYVGAILLRNGSEASPARIGVLDVGGATLADLNRWGIWQDQTASLVEGVTQGNGGKAYLFRMFSGEARLLGVRDGKRNCKGFEGPPGSKERGTPGFMPSAAAGCEAPINSVTAELDEILKPYYLSHRELPKALFSAIKERGAFTLVEGVEPRDVWRGRIPAEDWIQSTLLHEQATVVIEEVRVFAIHNGNILFGGKPLELEPVIPHPNFETLRPIEIPEQLPDHDGTLQSTTLDGKKSRGRLILGTSKDNMERNWRRLRPRWKITYSTGPQQPIGSKRVSELLPTTPGSTYVYATAELPALGPT